MAAKVNLAEQYDIKAFCDNDGRKNGTQLLGICVVSPQALSTIDYDLVVIASEYFEQIQHQLETQLAIPKQKIQVLNASQIKSSHFDTSYAKQQAEQVLLSLCAVLERCQIKYYVDAGTLLGIVRDDGLIPWDDDLDIAVPSSMLAEIRQHQEQILAALQKATACQWQITEWFAEQDFGLVKKGDTRSFKLTPLNPDSGLPLVDFFVKYLDEQTMDYVISSRGFTMPAGHMLHLAQQQFRGANIYIPSDVEGYLSRHYGDWQTPNPNWTLEQIQSATVFKRVAQ